MIKMRTDFLPGLRLIAAFLCIPSMSLWAQVQPGAVSLASLHPVAASTLPAFANYRLVKGPDPGCPWPPLPCIPTALQELNLPIYALGTNTFLIDDSTVDYAAIDAATELDTALLTLESPASLGSFDLAAMSEEVSDDPAPGYPPGSLWLALAMTNDPTYGSMAAITLNGTTNAAWYEIVSKGSLTDPAWWSEGSLPGLPAQTASLACVTADTNASSIFLEVRTLTNGSGGTLPIGWQLQNFGRTGLDPGSDPGGAGQSLLQSYLTGSDPNLLQFSVTATNNYVNASPALVQLEITGGVPFYQAVLVDSTNSAGAAWSVCSSTNLSVDLGSLEGWHDVWVGLRGLAASSHQTWQWKRLKLDRTAPELSLLTPAEGVVTQPTIQVVGSCPEALSAIWYDLSNATGLLPNQPVLMLDQYLATNTWEFTTDTFQAFDVNLAPGTNRITLHATDLAGNQTAANFTFNLDYSHKTNPPMIQLTWPQNGIQIGSSTFTLRGVTDDPTVTVQAQVAGTNGILRTLLGLVERTGNFWIDNIPLASGTNVVTLTIADAAGNSSSTNISVVQHAVLLTMYPVTPASQLWSPTVSVSGTVSDPTYAVWINGVKANSAGDGTWSAATVPVTPGGAAVFQMTGYSPDERQPDGSYGN